MTQPVIMKGQAVPSNEQRRASAKRKLERQLERRAQQARRRRTIAIAAGAVAVLVAIGLIGFVVFTSMRDDKKSTASSGSSTSSAPGVSGQALPGFTPNPEVGANCQYPPSSEPAAKQAKPPKAGRIDTNPAQVSASMSTDQGNIGLLLANNESPCTVNNFASLAQQGYFDGTTCHRLTTGGSLSVLQCGDPRGDGTGGPGYQFADEYPTDQYKPDDPALQKPVVYPRGTLAMANSGSNTNASQFFLVYKDSLLPPKYTVFGKIQQDGLATLDKIAQGGVEGGAGDGAPNTKVTIKEIRLD